MINPLHSLYFAIFILALQQFDGNILGPAILGESTGISSFWVIFSITLFGGLWGVTGMIVGVPLFAVFYAIIKTILTTKLSKKELPTETCKYVSVDYINTETNEFIDLLPESVKAKELKEKRRLQKEEKKAKYKALFAKKKEETSKQETSENDFKKN